MQKVQGGAETLNTAMGVAAAGMNLATADKNRDTADVQAAQAAKASSS